MHTTVRVIPRLDIKGPNLIKGIQFDGYRVLGAAEQFADHYYRQGADELIYQDSVASLYQRNSLLDMVRRTAERVFVPLTVAGGVDSVAGVRELLRAGADKVAINTAAVERPELIQEAARTFGSQCIVSSIEAFRRKDGRYEVWVDYGRQPTGVDVFEWIPRVIELGAGEILLTAIRHEGMGIGYDLELVARAAERASVPVIACGGAGCLEHFSDVVAAGADAVAAASVFHYEHATPAARPLLPYSEGRLRLGENVDSGNVDFLNHGYGKQRAIAVTPESVGAVKDHLAARGVLVRRVGKG